MISKNKPFDNANRMAKVNKLVEDTRTFAEIWKSLGVSSRLQLDLRDEIMRKTYVTRQTVYNWANTKSKPHESQQRAVASCVKRVLGISAYYRVLFP